MIFSLTTWWNLVELKITSGQLVLYWYLFCKSILWCTSLWRDESNSCCLKPKKCKNHNRLPRDGPPRKQPSVPQKAGTLYAMFLVRAGQEWHRKKKRVEGKSLRWKALPNCRRQGSCHCYNRPQQLALEKWQWSEQNFTYISYITYIFLYHLYFTYIAIWVHMCAYLKTGEAFSYLWAGSP